MRWLLFLLVLGCGTTESDGQPGVLNSMFLYNPESVFQEGQTYHFPAYWRALDGSGNELPVDSVGIRYSLGDSVTSGAFAEDFVLPQFTGFLYVFGPTTRDPMERLGRHYLQVLP